MNRMKLNGVEVQRLEFAKRSIKAGVFVDVTAFDRNGAEIVTYTGLDKARLDDVLGPDVGHDVAKYQGREGKFIGDSLGASTAKQEQQASAPGQEARAGSSYREETLYYRLAADGRDDKFFINAKDAGMGFASAKVEEQPRVFYEYRSIETLLGEELAPMHHSQPVALTMKDGDAFKHVFLNEDHAEFRAGYDTAHDHLNKHVQAVSLDDVSPPRTQDTPQPQPKEPQVNQSGNSIEPGTPRRWSIDSVQAQRMTFTRTQGDGGPQYRVRAYGAGDKLLSDTSGLSTDDLAKHFGDETAQVITAAKGRTGTVRIDAERPVLQTPQTTRKQVSPDSESVVNHDSQSWRDVSDHRDLTAEIERQFAQGKTASEVRAAMDKQLGFLPVEDRAGFIVGVRATLGVPSQGDEDGRREFAAWKAEYDKRVAASMQPQAVDPTASPASPQEPSPQSQADPAKEALEQRRKELVQSLKERFTVKGNTYHFKGTPERKAFDDHGSKLSTEHSTGFVVRGMLDLAECKGWSTVNLKGTDEFRREAWLQASQRGLQTRGYEPTTQDQQRLAELQQRQPLLSRNALEAGQAPARVPVGADPVPDNRQREQLLDVVRASLREGKAPQEAWTTVLKAANDHIDAMQARGEPLPTVRVKDPMAPSQRSQPMPQGTDQHQHQHQRVRH